MATQVALDVDSEAERGFQNYVDTRSELKDRRPLSSFGRTKRSGEEILLAKSSQPSFITNEKQQHATHQSSLARCLAIVVLLPAWYGAHSIFAIAMQKFASSPQRIEPSLGFALETSFAVATLQTIIGIAIGSLILRIRYGSEVTVVLYQESRGMIWVGLLHAIGVCCTNLGFLYGTASLIQMIKALEPLETLIWSVLLGVEARSSFGHVGSILVLIGGNMSVVTSHPAPPEAIPVGCAVLAGISLTLRNVVQRKLSNKTMSGSIVQFTLTTLFASLWCSLGTVLALILTKVDTNEGRRPLLEDISLKVVLFQPVFTLASMMILGLCSSLTHSLFNAGKRIGSVLVAILWLDEEWSKSSIAGFIAISFGTFAYVHERRYGSGGGSHEHTTATEFSGVHPVITLAILICLFLLPSDDEALE